MFKPYHTKERTPFRFALNLNIVSLALSLLLISGCQKAVTISGQVINLDGTPIANHPIMLLPRCKIPDMWERHSGWKGGYDYAFKTAFINGQPENPRAQTDETGWFSLQLNSGWFKGVCADAGQICKSRREDMEEANVECHTDGFTVALHAAGSEQYKKLFDLVEDPGSSQFRGKTTFSLPEEGPSMDLGVLTLEAGWLLGDFEIPNGMSKDALFEGRKLYRQRCKVCHGTGGTGGVLAEGNQPGQGRPKTLVFGKKITPVVGPNLADGEWVYSDGSFAGIRESLLQDVCGHELRLTSTVVHSDPPRYPLLDRTAAYISVLRYQFEKP